MSIASLHNSPLRLNKKASAVVPPCVLYSSEDTSMSGGCDTVGRRDASLLGTKVQLHILDHIPIGQQTISNAAEEKANKNDPLHRRQGRRRRKGRRRYDRDEHATVYISQGTEQLDDFEGATFRLYRRVGRDNEGSHATDLRGGSFLWAPVILRSMPSDCNFDKSTELQDESILGDDASAETTNTNNNPIPKLYVPSCLAATLGLHCFNTLHSSTPAYLQPLSAQHIVKASHVTLREIGVPPPIPNLSGSIVAAKGDGSDGGRRNHPNNINSSTNQQEDRPMECSDAEEQLRKFFLYPPTKHRKDDNELHMHPEFRRKKKPRQSKPRQRLLTVGSIFATATPASGVDYMGDDDREECAIQGARFYQVVDIQCALEKDTEDKQPSTAAAPCKGNAFIVSPSTHMVLLPSTDEEYKTLLHPQLNGVFLMNGYNWRLPSASLTLSFLRSVANSVGNSTTEKLQPTSTHSTTTRRIHHPSAKELVDALYLQGAVSAPQSFTKECHVCNNSISLSSTPASLAMNDDPRIIHLIGEEENHIKACVDEAADIMGMRSFHVDGLAAFWAHYNIFHAYSKQQQKQSSNQRTAPLTGALPDKLRGLAAALDIARQSSPCVLHIAGINGELSPTEGHAADLDARKEEERRILEAIREGTHFGSGLPPSYMPTDAGDTTATTGRVAQDTFLSTSTTPQIIVAFSTSNPLPPGPICSSLLQSSIEISPPDVDYARVLWDNDADGTFDSLSSFLLGLSAWEIRSLRMKFVPSWKSEMEDANDKQPKPLPADILQSLLPHLETTRSFTQSSSKGGSSTIPLSSSSLPNVRWEDIGGLESIRKEIMDAVELPLKHPDLFEGSRRSGILLFGPPGTGKTLVAKAVARECGLPFLSIKGPELLGSYVGESEANIRAVFDAARTAAMTTSSSLKEGAVGGGDGRNSRYSGASVLFFDELDSLAPRRGEMGHGDGVMDRVAATLLGELDGGGSQQTKRDSPSVIVIGATNRPDLLDPSLLRPGRFDRLLYLGPAKTKDHCLQILLAQTRKFRFQEDCDARTVLERAMVSFPPTLSGADLSAVASGALMRGLKRVCERAEEEARSLNLKKGVEDDSEMAVDIDDVMESWSKEQLQHIMTDEDFVEAANEIVPSISEQDLEKFEELQRHFSSLTP